jgi:sphinganine-1-phosphate aldolase
LSLLAYREKARTERGVTQPNVVCSNTAHPAFDKGAHYFGIELRKVPVT